MTHSAVAVVQSDDELLEDPASLLLCQAAHRAVPQSVLQENCEHSDHIQVDRDPI